MRWIFDQGFAVYGEDGAIQRVVGFAEDITDRKLAEQQIERLVRFPSENPSPVLRVDDGGTIIYANDASDLLLGCWATQVGGRPPHTLTAVLQGALVAAEVETVHVECGESIFSLDLAPVVEEGYVNVYGRDVTERTWAEVALRESEIRYHSLFEYSPVALWEEDFSEVKKYIDGLRAKGVADLRAYLDEHPDEVMHCFRLIKVHDVNQAALNLYCAQSKEDLTNVSEVIVPDESVGVFASVLAGFADGETFLESEGPQLTLTGDRIHHQGYTAILPGYEESWAHVLVSIFDITERKRAEREREVLIAELEVKNAELERFTYTVSHDLKSPLITIKGFLGFLERDLETGDRERMQDDLSRICSAAERMEQLLNELLELSRIGRIVNPPEEVDLAELAHEAVSMVVGCIDERGVEVPISPDLPMVYADRTRLQEVFENLVENAQVYG
jgi:PAS domain-containing protein